MLDTDTLSLGLRGHTVLTGRILSLLPEQVWISALSVEEILLHGRFAMIQKQYDRRTRTLGLQRAYELLTESIRALAPFNVWPYDDAAEALFQSWPAHVKRVGRYDCRIAASAITHGLTVVTCNKKDFSGIPNLVYEDWTR